MNKREITPEKIQKHNAMVDYNKSIIGWVVDIVCLIIAWPTIILAIHRRIKYKEMIDSDSGDNEL